MSGRNSDKSSTDSDKILRVSSKLRDSLKAGDFYGALQMYRTIVKRKIDSSALKEAEALVVDGVKLLTEHGKGNEAADLADMLLKTYSLQKLSLTPHNYGVLKTICDLFNESLCNSKLIFTRFALRWLSDAPGSTSQGSFVPIDDDDRSDADIPVSESVREEYLAYFYLQTARACIHAAAIAKDDKKNEFYSDAQKYFLRANAGKEFAEFLEMWAKTGYEQEVDLYLARAVLRLLCLKDLANANIVYSHYISLPYGSKAASTPLAHYLRFLLLTLERDAAPLFKLLNEKYKASLERDPSFLTAVETIGLNFYNIRPAGANGMENMMKMMQSMMGGGFPGMPGGGRGGPGGMPFPFPFPR